MKEEHLVFARREQPYAWHWIFSNAHARVATDSSVLLLIILAGFIDRKERRLDRKEATTQARVRDAMAERLDFKFVRLPTPKMVDVMGSKGVKSVKGWRSAGC